MRGKLHAGAAPPAHAQYASVAAWAPARGREVPAALPLSGMKGWGLAALSSLLQQILAHAEGREGAEKEMKAVRNLWKQLPPYLSLEFWGSSRWVLDLGACE